MESIEALQHPSTLQEALKSHIRHIPIKRTFDIAFSICVLTLGLPIFTLIGFLIWATSPGKVIYAHKRIGRGGIPFRCYKFRTMRHDADEKLQQLLIANPEIRSEWELNRKLKHDPRVTGIGWFLRKTSLDELPQFWNVLLGDLSVVGPRPVIHKEITDHLGLKAYKILSIRPGITGLWQVSGRSDLSYSSRISLDEHYIDHQSLSLDLKIVLKTVPVMLAGRGAY